MFLSFSLYLVHLDERTPLCCKSSWLPFIMGLQPARLCSKCSIVIVSLHCPRTPTEADGIPPFYRGKNGGLQRLSNLAKPHGYETFNVHTVSGSKIHVLLHYTVLGGKKPPPGECSL